MKTTVWGPAGWIFLHSITFNYPEVIDENDADHCERRKYTKQLFENLQYTLPCRYCRESFKIFLSELPIDEHLSCRKDITKWLYHIHNKVNAKLRKQEMEAVENKFIELETKVKNKQMSGNAAYRELKTFVEKTMITDVDPSFDEVCEKYESYRAQGCTNPVTEKKQPTKMATCRGK